MRRLSAALALTALLTAACGSTVQVQQQRAVGAGDGLGATGTTGDSLGTTGSTGGGTGTSGTTGTALPGTGTSGRTGTTGGAGTTGGGVLPGTSGSTGASGTTTTGGGARNHDPIQVGYVATSVGNAAALGINAGSTYTDKAMFDALVAEYNAAGGLAGHRIVPVYGETDTASSNWAAQFAQVCAKFTQDNHVKVVVGYVFVFIKSFESCLAKAGIPHLYGGYQPGDVVDQRQYPWLIATGHPTVDGFDLTALDGALRTGLINAKTKMGFLTDSCADGDRAFTGTVVPWLRAHNVNYQAVSMACSQGASDVSGAASAVSSAELRFAANGVNLVFASGVALLVFMEDAQSQGYTPEYVTAVGGAALEANGPANQMKHLHGFGWMPSIDVNPSHQPYGQTAGQKACIAKLVRHGLKPTQYNDFMAAYQACDGLELYARALAATGTTSAQPLVDAVGHAMATFQSAGTYSGGLRAASRQRGGPSVYRAYAWTDACSCSTYRGPTFPIPTP